MNHKQQIHRPMEIHFGVLMRAHEAQVHTMPFPAVGPTDVVVKMQAVNLCTTDYQQWMGLREHQGYPMAAGHEFSGIIVERGEEVSDALSIGMQVSAIVNACMHCSACLSGHTGDCTEKPNKQRHADGYYGLKRFADYIVTDEKMIVPIDRAVPAAQAALLEPVATAVQAARKARICPLELVVVIGAGTMGLINAQVAHALGARVVITEVDAQRVERARSMGIAQVVDAANEDPVQAVRRYGDGLGADCVIAAVGSSHAYAQAEQMLKMRGRLVFFAAGYPKPQWQPDTDALCKQKRELIGTFGCALEDWSMAAMLLSEKRIDVSYALSGQTFPLYDLQRAYETASQPGMYRVTVDPQQAVVPEG